MKKIKKILFIGLIFGIVIASILTVAACKDTDEALKLDAPQNVFVSTLEKQITWDVVTNATGYILLFDEGSYVEVEHNYYDYGHITDGGEYWFRVMAVGTTYNDSDWSTRRVFQVTEKLASPKNIVATESKIIWDSVKSASGYIVKIGNNEPEFVSKNVYEITDFSIGLSSIKVKAISNKGYFLDSDFTSGERFFAGLCFNLVDEGNAYELVKASTELKGDFTIPSVFNDLPVTTIRGFAFDDCKKIVNLVIPNSIVNFGMNAFVNTALERISLSFEGIRDDLPISTEWSRRFYSLFEASNPEVLPNEVIITGGIRIGSSAFFALSIEKVVISTDSIKEIGDRAFYGCQNIKSFIVPDSVTTIGNDVFGKCFSLENIVLPYGIAQIPNYAFFECSSLTEIEIPNSVTKIGYAAFMSSGLKSVVIPDSVTEIDKCAFEYCAELQDVTLSKNLKVLDWCVFDKTAIKSIAIPHGVEGIYYAAFRDCEFLEYIVIPETIEIIANSVLPADTVVFYVGTEQQWGEVDDSSVQYRNDLYFYSETKLVDGRHWGYQDGVPTIW